MTIAKVARVVGFPPATTDTESVADILERQLHAMIEEWLEIVEKELEITRIRLNFEGRTGHLR